MRILSSVAITLLATACASSPQVVDSTPTSVTIQGDSLSWNSDQAVFAIAAQECRKHGRRAMVARSDTMRLNPKWEFHCIR